MKKEAVLFFVALYLIIGFAYWYNNARGFLRPVQTVLAWPYVALKAD